MATEPGLPSLTAIFCVIFSNHVSTIAVPRK